MKYVFLFFTILLGSMCANADSPQPPGLLESLNYEADGEKFRAEAILDDGNDCDLVIYNIKNEKDPILLVRKNDFLTCTSRTDVAGRIHRFKLNSHGGLQASSTWAESGVGRDHWDETITIVHRNGKIWVGGYSYKTEDDITGYRHDCDVNYLSGHEDIIDRSDSREPTYHYHLKINTPIPLLSTWSKDHQPPRCKPAEN